MCLHIIIISYRNRILFVPISGKLIYAYHLKISGRESYRIAVYPKNTGDGSLYQAATISKIIKKVKNEKGK